MTEQDQAHAYTVTVSHQCQTQYSINPNLMFIHQMFYDDSALKGLNNYCHQSKIRNIC